MRMSCNGCRVLRKGCSENCTIRPCLEWITSPEAQSNATVFLAKFYGRAGLVNLLNAGDQFSRPAIFKSLLYEACGRIVNPINGATGLLCSGNWHLCQAAVDAVFSGASVAQLSPESASTMMIPPPFKAGDIRHVAKDDNVAPLARGVHKAKTRGQRKKAAGKSKIQAEPADDDVNAALVMWSWSHESEEVRVPSSHGSGVSLGELPNWAGLGSDSAASVETVEASLAEPGEPVADGSGIELELTLGIEPVAKKIKVGQ